MKINTQIPRFNIEKLVKAKEAEKFLKAVKKKSLYIGENQYTLKLIFM